MQLPRGTFQGIKKEIGVASLLEELQDVRFTGSAAIEVDGTAGNLVFRKGKVLLAEFGSDRGDYAVERVKCLGDRSTHASLSELTEPQISLAKEFNPESRLQGGNRPSTPRSGGAENPALQQRDAEYSETPKKPEVNENGTSDHPSPLSGPSEIQSLVEAIESSHSRKEQEAPSPLPPPPPLSYGTPLRKPDPIPDLEETANDESTARDLDALDGMDLDGMAEKIRTNCKFMVEKMNLGHLIENENQE